MKILEKITKKVASLLGLATKQDIMYFNMEVECLKLNNIELRKENETLAIKFSTLQENVRTLYTGLDSDIRNVKLNVRKIKPILKIEDKEAVKFIKGILSKHDSGIQTQQSFLEMKKFELNELESSARKSIEAQKISSEKLNNLLSSLGVNNEDAFIDFKEVVAAKLAL